MCESAVYMTEVAPCGPTRLNIGSRNRISDICYLVVSSYHAISSITPGGHARSDPDGDADAAVHPLRPRDGYCAPGIVKTERSSQERSQTDVELKNRRDPFQDV